MLSRQMRQSSLLIMIQNGSAEYFQVLPRQMTYCTALHAHSETTKPLISRDVPFQRDVPQIVQSGRAISVKIVIGCAQLLAF